MKKTPLQRHTRLTRTQPMSRGSSSPGSRKPRKGRKPSETERIYGPREFRDWLHAQPCAVCGAPSVYTQQAHAVGGGTGRKADWTFTFPACGPHIVGGILTNARAVEGCHHEAHRRGVRTFERERGVTLRFLVKQTQQRWRRHLAAVGPTPQEDR